MEHTKLVTGRAAEYPHPHAESDEAKYFSYSRAIYTGCEIKRAVKHHHTHPISDEAKYFLTAGRLESAARLTMLQNIFIFMQNKP